MTNPLQTLLNIQDVAVLDGAMATELEARGAEINDPLWSAKVLLEQPELIEAVHYDYFAAGADVAITASYQASFEGFAARGLPRDQAAALMRRSVRLAIDARERFLATPEAAGRARPLVAASVGPYGAFLHNGSEYRGDYGLSVAELVAWHRPRFAVLAAAGADLLACETIPSLAEGQALAQLIDEYRVPAWLSFSCRDGAALNHGEPMAEAAALAQVSAHVAAVGVNCTAPRYVASLLEQAAHATSKPLLCYPNSGEAWDAAAGCWLENSSATEFGPAAQMWRAAGARVIGGCCRTGPAEIAAIRAILLPN
jgi:homocysteine S-methyltransferase